MVSVDPIKTDAIFPVKLSGPQLDKILSRIAREPLPEIGLKIIKGITWLGTFKVLKNKLANEEKTSKNPEALSIVTAVINPTSEGTIENVEYKPSFAPKIKALKISTFLIKPNPMMMVINIGTM